MGMCEDVLIAWMWRGPAVLLDSVCLCGVRG